MPQSSLPPHLKRAQSAARQRKFRQSQKELVTGLRQQLHDLQCHPAAPLPEPPSSLPSSPASTSSRDRLPCTALVLSQSFEVKTCPTSSLCRSQPVSGSINISLQDAHSVKGLADTIHHSGLLNHFCTFFNLFLDPTTRPLVLENLSSLPSFALSES